MARARTVAERPQPKVETEDATAEIAVVTTGSAPPADPAPEPDPDQEPTEAGEHAAPAVPEITPFDPFWRVQTFRVGEGLEQMTDAQLSAHFDRLALERGALNDAAQAVQVATAEAEALRKKAQDLIDSAQQRLRLSQSSWQWDAERLRLVNAEMLKREQAKAAAGAKA